MADFKELVEDYELQITDTSIEGVRAFYKYTGASGSLPTIGDSFTDPVSGDNFPTCILRTQTFGAFYPNPADRSKWHRKIICTYSSQASTGTLLSGDEEERRFTAGGEIITIDNPSGWVWEGGGDAIDQPTFLSNVAGTFTRQKVFNSTSQKDTWLEKHLFTKAGTVNDTVFEGYTKGSVLFNGISGGTQSDTDGRLKWVFELQFAYRLVRAAGAKDFANNPIVQDDWQYAWRKTSDAGNGVWDIPNTADGDRLFVESHFQDMF